MKNCVGIPPVGLAVLIVGVGIAGAGCKKLATLDFEPASAIVIDSDKGAPLPKVVGKTADGELIELDQPVALAVLPVGVVELQRDKLVPMKNGKAKVTATAGEITSSVDVTVRIIDEVRASCPFNPCVIRVGDAVQLVGQVMGLGANYDSEVVWTSSSDAVVKLDESVKGKALGVAPGKATLTVEAAGKQASVEVEVRSPVDEVRLFCPWPPMMVSAKAGGMAAIKDRSCAAAVGERMKLMVEAIAAGVPSVDERAEWSSSDASVSVVQGELTPDHVGGAVVSVRAANAFLEVPVAVSPQKRGAPPCDDTAVAWTSDASPVGKAAPADAAWEEPVSLRCQGRAGTECVTTAWEEMNRELPSFNLDADSAKRFHAFFIDETARRCCCARK